jgi:hypothetical protein
MNCPDLETLGAYCLGELADADGASFEEHYFACDRCTGRLARMQAFVGQLETMLPHILTPERRKRLEASGQPLAVTRLAPGGHGTIRFGGPTALGFWILRAPLSTAERVDFELREAGGAPVLALRDVPFDREQGEVVLACQSAYRELGVPTALRARISSVEASGRSAVSEYVLDHLFDFA